MIYGKPRRINETDGWRDESAWREYYTRANQKLKAKKAEKEKKSTNLNK